MKTILLLTFCFEMLLFNYSAFSQHNCPNANFSDHDFTNWQGFTGTYDSCCFTLGIVPGRHTIIDSVGTDPNTGNLLSILPPGLSVGARLGNSNVGAEAEKLVYSFIVDSSNAIFYYSFAVVFEDPAHTPAEQPKFDIVIQASSSVGLNGEYHVVSGGSIPGFQSYGTTRWKDWATIGIDLSPFIGEQVSVDYTNYDCAQSGHYGYAYLSCSCDSNIIKTNYTQNFDQVTLTAPIGFKYLWNTGDTIKSITINNPISGTIYSCNLISINGYTSTLSVTILIPTETNIISLTENNIYPNPTNNKSFVKLPESNSNIKYSYTLYSMNNQIIIKDKGVGNEIEINTSNIASGNYILIIQTSTNNKYKAKITVN